MVARRRRLLSEGAPVEGAPPENGVPVPAAVAVPQAAVVSADPPLHRTKEDDAFNTYETFVRVWGPLSVYVRRSSGSPATWMIDHYPPTGAHLYAALKRLHGQSPEAEYELRFHSGSVQRGIAYVTLPHMPENPPQQGQLVHYQQPPYQAPPPPPQYPPGGHQQQPPPPQQYAQQPPPQQQSAPTGMTWEQFQAFQKREFDLFLATQRSGSVPTTAPPTVAPPPPPPPQQPPPAPPPGASPMDQWAAFHAMQRQQWEMFREMHGTVQPQPQPQPVQQQQPAPVQQQQVQTPPGMVRTDIGFISAEKLLRAMVDDGRPSGGPGYRAPYGPRSPYYGEQPPPVDGSQPPSQYGGGYRPPYAPQQQPPPAPKTAVEVMREAVTLVRTLNGMAEEFRPPQPAAVAAPEPVAPDDDSPIRVIDVGAAKLLVNQSDGSARLWESLLANAPGAFKFVGEQMDAIRKQHTEREARKQAQRQQLPPGYVEVGPGYVPPEGFVAVPVGVPVQQAVPQPARPAVQPQPVLPDPPVEMPAPIVEVSEQPQQAWTPPIIPGAGQ